MSRSKQINIIDGVEVTLWRLGLISLDVYASAGIYLLLCDYWKTRGVM